MTNLLFPLLLAGHLLGDFLVQTDWMSAFKARPDCWAPALRPHVTLPKHLRKSWVANQVHVTTYHSTLLLCLLPWLAGPYYPTPPVRFWTGIAASWVLHSLLDRRWPVAWLLRVTGSPRFADTAFGMMSVDQSLHVVTLVALAVWWTA